MDNLTSAGSGETDLNIPTHTPPSKLKTYGFIIAIIVGIGGLAVGAAGVTGYFHVGALSNLAQIDAIIMMTVGGGGGVILLIVGIVGTVKNRKTDHRSEISSDYRNRHSTLNKQKKRTRDTEGRQTEFINRTSAGTIRDAQHFGKAEWETYFGDVGDEPPLPKDINEILNSPCPFSGDKDIKVKDTHMLVLVPATVNGEALTLDKLGQLIQHPKQGNKTKYFFYDQSRTQQTYGSIKVEQSHWVLMTRDVLPDSRQKMYAKQKNLVEKYANQGYIVPDAIDAAVCMLMEFVASGTYLYGRKPMTYTRCAQTIDEDKYPVVVGHFGVGAFGPPNLTVNEHLDICSTNEGIAALRKF